MFKTLQSYHFGELPQELQKKAESMIQDLSPLGILYEGTIDAVEVWGKDDILTLMRAMYFEAKHENNNIMDWKEIQNIDRYIQETENYLLKNTSWDGIKDWNFYKEVEYKMKKQS